MSLATKKETTNKLLHKVYEYNIVCCFCNLIKCDP